MGSLEAGHSVGPEKRRSAISLPTRSFRLVSWFRSSHHLDIRLRANFETGTTLGINTLLVSFDSEIRRAHDIEMVRIRNRDTSPKGIMMTCLRFIATALLAFILCLAWDGGGHSAFAQFQRAAPATGRPPVAAPT